MAKGTYPRSPKTRRKNSDALRGRPKSPEHRAAIGDAMMGHVVTAQTRAKMGASHRARSLALVRREAQKEARERAILVWQALGEEIARVRGANSA